MGGSGDEPPEDAAQVEPAVEAVLELGEIAMRVLGELDGVVGAGQGRLEVAQQARDLPAAAPAARPSGVVPAVSSLLSSFIWHADQLPPSVGVTVPTGFAALDAELLVGGWPCGALTELLQPQPSVTKWRLLGRRSAKWRPRGAASPSSARRSRRTRRACYAGIDPCRLLWLRADTPAERLWCTEQLVRANACGALVAWLPQARSPAGPMNVATTPAV